MKLLALALALTIAAACNGSATKPSGPGGAGGEDPQGGEGGDGGRGGQGGSAGKGGRGGSAGQGGAPAADAGSAGTGGGGATDGPSPGAEPAPGPDTTVTAFDKTYVYFAGMDNKRVQNVKVTFPAMPLTYEKITLNLALSCPPAVPCDAYDRRAHLGVVRQVDGKDSVTEILRFMTPFGWPVKWAVDVTDLRPLLSGEVTLQIFIDTWVGPNSGNLGRGWVVDASFELVGGTPERVPIAVIPLWDSMSFEYGNPMKPIADAVSARQVTIPAEATAVALRSLITGHGQGNLENCAEFCRRDHTFSIGGMPKKKQVWRPDCMQTAVHNPNPASTPSWKYPRAGWCPGADVLPWVEDVTSLAAPGSQVTVGYDVATYVNSCRPDSAMCAGCSLNTGCAYDNGSHTMPVFVMSAALVVYR